MAADDEECTSVPVSSSLCPQTHTGANSVTVTTNAKMDFASPYAFVGVSAEEVINAGKGRVAFKH